MEYLHRCFHAKDFHSTRQRNGKVDCSTNFLCLLPHRIHHCRMQNYQNHNILQSHLRLKHWDSQLEASLLPAVVCIWMKKWKGVNRLGPEVANGKEDKDLYLK
ncbi:hypothetical protein RO3G_03567 [Rhizopus delemar RA 99-880]|uniref:Uncharacterized protein n=1 Tax=Rhizopus delemar (strain RA 99-880 / ATCC MYA-4621 / FGSC 9543 / NRRL 43880) TaxID=246409 RepID=I1BRN2_RHIO9|nr:hypothetical protein RO3G_03567 [Rhizopus delemar RA 99-880]|eukprot:EIE78862.1 hypothetical protein RO3G_03567 [Rhizopus delemar RA 99-880]